MVHTLELSKEISQETYEAMLQSLADGRYNRVAWYTKAYAEKGIPMVCLRKFKPRRRDKNGKWVVLESEPFIYMAIMSVNPGKMFGIDGYHSSNSSIFTPDFAKAIYQKIFEQIPELEVLHDYKEQGDMQYWNTGIYPKILKEYDAMNTFKLRRIDYAFDISTTSEQYIQLIEWGKGIRRKSYKRQRFDVEEIVEHLEDVDDEEPDFEDSEELFQEYIPDIKYIYYKSKSLNINIYLKGDQLKKRGLLAEDDNAFDFLRIEIQVKKNKLNAINQKYGIHGRDFHKMPIPELEAEILTYYMNQLTGNGTYVEYDTAMEIIDKSNFRTNKKMKLKKLIYLIAQNHGIKTVLDKVENGDISDLGKMSTVRTYLKDIETMGINPTTISDAMKECTPTTEFVNQTGTRNLNRVVLANLVDVIKWYNQQKLDERQHGMVVTQEDLNQIDNL